MSKIQHNLRAEFVPYRLTQARKAKGYNMTELAEELGLTRQAISQFEKGKAKPSAGNLRVMSSILGVTESFFLWPITFLESSKESPASFRSMISSKAKAREQAATWIEWSAATADGLFNFAVAPENKVPDFKLDDFNDLKKSEIEKIATEVRRIFGLGDGPISNLTLLLENNGVFVVFKKLAKELSGLSQWFNGYPFVLIDPKSSACRTRFSLAHELGHLVLHKNLITEDDLADKETFKKIEFQADYFASVFLLPEATFPKEVYQLSWDGLISLKSRWRVSIAAIVMRLHQLNIISSHQKTRLFQLISSKNARRHEPLDNEIEQDNPRVSSKIIDMLDQANVIKPYQLLERIILPPDEISSLTGVPKNKFLASDGMSNVIYLR